MAYTPQFTPTYPNGWVDFPSEETLVTAAALQAYDDTLENIEEYLEGFDPNNNLADQYDAEEGIYAVDDYVMYEDTLYQCITAVSEPETFDPEKWTEVKITDVMGGGGGGGTTVIANPIGEPTDDLETIQIGNTIYDIPGGGGGSANIWTGTMAEYEAQASQIPNDTLVNITDDEGEIEVGGEYYSTEERCIGTWTDGKPLYQISLVIPNTTLGSWGEISHGVQNIETTVHFSGTYKRTSDGACFDLNCYNSSTTQSIVAVNLTKVSYYIGTGLGNGTIELTFKYTKTTDSPIPLATKVMPSYEVYSTNEQIVGQWIDGSPIYEKTISTGAMPNYSDKSVAHGISNLSRVISVSGSAKNTTANYYIPLPYPQNDVSYQVAIYVDNTNIHLTTGRDMTAYNESYVTIRYTKSTS